VANSNVISKNQAANTVLIEMRGPVEGRNWFDFNYDPTYKIKQTGTGNVKLQGTNDESFRSPHDDNQVNRDWLPPESATWTDIASGTGDMSGTFTASYKFLRWILTTNGNGQITEMWVRWN